MSVFSLFFLVDTLKALEIRKRSFFVERGVATSSRAAVLASQKTLWQRTREKKESNDGKFSFFLIICTKISTIE